MIIFVRDFEDFERGECIELDETMEMELVYNGFARYEDKRHPDIKKLERK